MRPALFALLCVVVPAAAALLIIQPVAAQLPRGCDYQEGQITYTWQRTWDEERQSWILQRFVCAADNEWQGDQILHDFNTSERPDSWHFTGRFDAQGNPEIGTRGSPPVASSPDSYWNATTSRQIQRGISSLVYAGNVCQALRDGEITGGAVNPSHVYRVGNGWHYIEDADDRAALGRPDARMSTIWGYRTEFRDHDNALQPRCRVCV